MTFEAYFQEEFAKLVTPSAKFNGKHVERMLLAAYQEGKKDARYYNELEDVAGLMAHALLSNSRITCRYGDLAIEAFDAAAAVIAERDKRSGAKDDI